VGHGRSGSISSVGHNWYAGEPTHPNLPSINAGQGAPTFRVPVPSGSPGTTNVQASHNVLPGYRDAIFGPSSQNQNQQTLAWRDATREADSPQLPRIINISDRRSGQLGTRPTHFENHMTSASARSNSAFTSPPPLLTHESTAASSASSLFYPGTPLEPSLDGRSLPMPGQTYGKPSPLYDTQLPPLRASSSISPKHTSSPFGSKGANSKFTLVFDAEDARMEDPRISTPSSMYTSWEEV
jgi:hypothetical protein